MTEEDHIKFELMHKDIEEIKSAVIGNGLHKNGGLIDRICKIEKAQSNNMKTISIATGIGAGVGFFIAWIKGIF